MSMEHSQKPLRILAVVNLAWDRRLGASRVWLELGEEWRAAGHIVDKYSLTDAFPKPSRRSAMIALRQVMFAYRAARFIRKNAARYDVIDALLGTVPFSKKRLGFRGLLVARSVGFYRLYEKFDVFARNRWPDLSRGKLIGRLLYTLTRKRWLKAANDAVRHADLINLANEDELISLREEIKSSKPAIVQPYGLSPERWRALSGVAASPESRLARKKISFIGAWTVRKGSKDWAKIVQRIRAEIPEATFRFLGTMTEDAKVLHDLGLQECDYVDLVREYEPDALPELLADCALGIFPSYVEGFPFGLLEQLASGIPTIAYDAPGARRILEPMRDRALIELGETDGLAKRAIEMLRQDLNSYNALREQALAIAARYSWPQIATETLHAYRQALAPTGAIVFTHPFGLRSTGGGARIMRALLRDAPNPVLSVCTSPEPPPEGSFVRELHVPPRPSFGRIERTRFAGLAHSATPVFARGFARRLEQACLECNAAAIHSIAHAGMDFYSALLVAKKMSIPFFLHMHDDFVYSARGYRSEGAAHKALSEAWQSAVGRFVICAQLGDEYCRRYGKRDYVVVTDGLDRVAAAPVQRSGRDLRIYFMGLFHLEYEENLKILLAALAELREAGRVVSITLRCGSLRPNLIRGYEELVRVLPFASESDVESDLEKADLLYLPLPFEKKYDPFVRFSLSTKMVTYIGSGIPTLYHGPFNSAVHDLLSEHRAALLSAARDPRVLAETLQHYVDLRKQGMDAAANALELAKRKFMLRDIRERFWGVIDRSLGK
ncbi:MAG: hypothetical protein QOI04_2235 [Verrucomicrobiota bacterium]|jgi:glycosyltransferase involved in cell wall biosynthesis